jgi:D-arabinitol dehydrogenase (NADP+)
MRAVQIVNANEIRIAEIENPTPGQREAKIQVAACGICGTDIHIYRGEYLGDYPIIPGHEFAGTVTEVGREVTRFKEGDRVAVEPNISCNNCYNCLNNRQNFCLNWQAVGVTRPGAMAEYVCVPEEAIFDIGELPLDRGAFVEPLSCVLHGIQRVELTLADRILIIGAGPIGLLLLKTAKLQGVVEITSVDKNKERLKIAQAAGATSVCTSLDELQKDKYDTVIDATGVPGIMSRTLDYVRHGGTVLLFGVPPADSRMSLTPFTIFRKALKILSSFTSLRNSYQAVDLLKSGRIDVSDLISHRLPLTEMQRGIKLIEQGADRVMKVLILPGE